MKIYNITVKREIIDLTEDVNDEENSDVNIEFVTGNTTDDGNQVEQQETGQIKWRRISSEQTGEKAEK